MKNYFFWFKIAIGLILFLSFLFVTVLTVDPDFYWHLKEGEWIVQNNAPPHYDIYSHTMPGFEWVDHEWLVEAAWWLLYSKGLWFIAVFLFSLVSFIPFFFWLRRARSCVHLWFIVLIALATMDFIGMRVQVFSFLFFFIVLEILRKKYDSFEQSKTFSKSFLLLPFIFLVWANIHAGFFSGLILCGMYIVTHYAIGWWKQRKHSYRLIITDVSILAASFVATLINPYGWKMYQMITDVMLSSDTTKYIIEWRPVFAMNNFYILFLIALFSFVIVRYWKKYPPALACAGVVLFIMFIKSIKMGPLFFMMVIPLLAYGEQFFREEVSFARRDSPLSIQTKEKMKAGAIVLFCFLFFSFGSHMRPFVASLTYDSLFFPPRISHSFENAVAALKEESQRTNIGNIFNRYAWGGYLIFYAPEIKVFIDGRMPHWIDAGGNSAMQDFVKIYYESNEKQRKEILIRRNIETVFMENSRKIQNNTFFQRVSNALSINEEKQLQTMLINNGWSILYENEEAIILRCPEGLCWK